MDDGVFKQNFRMHRSTFYKLCDRLSGLTKQDTVLRAAIPLHKRIAVAIYALASSAEYRTIGNLFGIGKSTVCELLLDFCQEVWVKLSPLVLKNPLNAENVQKCVECFEELGFPQCLGAIGNLQFAIQVLGI